MIKIIDGQILIYHNIIQIKIMIVFFKYTKTSIFLKHLPHMNVSYTTISANLW